MEPPNNSVETVASANGPLAPIAQGLPDLNADVGLNDMLPPIRPIQAQEQLPLAIANAELRSNAIPQLEEFNL